MNVSLEEPGVSSNADNGLRAWLGWCGLVDAPEAVVARGTAKIEGIGKYLYRPVSENDSGTQGADADADLLMESLALAAGVRPKPFWPGNAPYAVCVTHDIDRIYATYQRLRGFFHSPLRSIGNVLHDVATRAVPRWRERNPFNNIMAMRQIEKGWGITSAAYVLFERPRPWLALRRGEFQHVLGVYSPEDIMPQLRTYEAEGNEVGLHGSFDSWNDARGLERDLRVMRACGVNRVLGVRNHYLRYDALNTPLIQSKAGFLYDSTLGFNLKPGFRCGTCFPFMIDGVVEIPLLVMDTALRFAFDSPQARYEAAHHVLHTVRERHGVLVVNWHLHYMNQRHFPDWVDLLNSIVSTGQRDGAWIATPREVALWWARRSGSRDPRCASG